MALPTRVADALAVPDVDPLLTNDPWAVGSNHDSQQWEQPHTKKRFWSPQYAWSKWQGLEASNKFETLQVSETVKARAKELEEHTGVVEKMDTMPNLTAKKTRR